MRRRAFLSVAIFAGLLAALVATSFSTAAPPGAASFNLYAGKTTDVGDVKVWNDATNLYVEIVLDSGWCMTESHVAAATTSDGIPQNSQKNPTPGQFPYGDTYSPCESTGDLFTIPLPGLLGSPLVIAVHAEVLGAPATLNVFSDGGNTTVTASTAGGALPRPAVDAWEAFGDPADPTPSTWDSGVGVGTFALADWIWSDYRVNTPADDETATFVRTFAVPGPVAPGSWMKVTTDDAYVASLNGTQVASDTHPNWPSVETASPFAPIQGSNTLSFVATNSDLSNGSAGTIDNNPGGLIYEAQVNYFTRSESAWAASSPGESQFNPSKSWATYFTFTPSLPTVRIANNPQIGEGGVLEYQAVLSQAPTVTTTVTIETDAGFSLAQPPGDYTTKTETLTFVPGDTTETFSVQTNEDALYEPAVPLGPGEYVWAHITGGTNVSLPGSQDFVSNLDLTDRWGLGFILDDELAGDILMGDNAPGGVPDQHLTFVLDDSPDSGTYGYVNIDGAVDYSGSPSCVDFDAGTPNVLRFAYQIPPGEGALTGIWIVWQVTGGATPTAGFSVAPDGATATSWCNGGFVPASSFTVHTVNLLNF